MGAVNFAVGFEGCDYTSPSGKAYKLTGWTFEAKARQESFLEQRSFAVIDRMQCPLEEKAAARALLAKEIGAMFACSYGSKLWDESLSAMAGVAHFFSVLASCSFNEAQQLLSEDPEGVQEAIFKANPRYRATAENPKGQ